MSWEIFEKLDKNKSQTIELSEIENALKKGWILDTPENVKKVVKELKDNLVTNIEKSFKLCLVKACGEIQNKPWRLMIEKENKIMNLVKELEKQGIKILDSKNTWWEKTYQYSMTQWLNEKNELLGSWSEKKLKWLEKTIEYRKKKMEFVFDVGRSLIDILEDRKSKLAPNTGKIAWQLQLAINKIDTLIDNPNNLSMDNLLWDVVTKPDGTLSSAGKKFGAVKNALVNNIFASFSAATTYANTREVNYSLMAKWINNREKIPWTQELNAFVLFMKQKLYGEYALTSQYKWLVFAKIREYWWAATSEKILWYLKDDILKSKELGDIWAMRSIFQKILEVQKPKWNLMKMDRFDAKQIVQKIFWDSIKDPEVREELEDYVDDAIDDFKEQKAQIISKEWKKDIAKSAVIPILQQYYGGNPKDIWFELKAEKVAENISNNDPDPFGVEGLEELWKDLHNPESGVKIDIYKMVLQSQASAIQMTAESILSDKLIEWTLEAYSSSVTKVRWKNMAIELYADILGVGPWDLSDKNIERIKFRWKEIAVSIITIAISWWIAWVATRWVMLTSSLFLRSAATSARILKFANNIRKFYMIKNMPACESLWQKDCDCEREPNYE